MTLVLAIETATPRCSVAVGHEAGLKASFSVDRDRRHVEAVVPAVAAACRAAGVALADLDALAVDIGPGLFTGMRVGIATAQALGLALGLPVHPVSSLDVLAHPFRHAGPPVASVVDARRGEVFSAFYRQVPGGVQRLTKPRVGSVEELLADLMATGEECLAVGDGALRYAEDLRALNTVEVADAGLAFPSAASLVQLAHARALREEFVNPWDVTPVYLRKADAEINWAVRSPATT